MTITLEGAMRVPRESPACLHSTRVVLLVTLLVAGLPLSPNAVRAQTAARPPAPAKLSPAAGAHFAAGQKLLAEHNPKQAEAEIRAGLALAPRTRIDGERHYPARRLHEHDR